MVAPLRLLAGRSGKKPVDCKDLYLSQSVVLNRLIAVLCLLWAGSLWAQSSGWVQTSHLKAQLVSDYQDVRPGQKLTLALNFITKPNWHTYWQNPGDSGLATTIHWTLPPGVQAGPLQWPTPELIAVPPLVNYGYYGATSLLTTLDIDESFRGSVLPIRAKAEWLVCDEICLPVEASLELTLTVSAESSLSLTEQDFFQQARAALPQQLASVGRYEVQNGCFSAVLNLPQSLPVSSFFVGGSELVDHAAVQHISWHDGQLLLRQPQNTYFSSAPAQLSLLLQTTEAVYQVELDYNTGPALQQEVWQWSEWVGMLLLALAGGVLLNLMPCVFPVLSLKALHLISQPANQVAMRRQALAYSAGVLVSFLVLAGLMLSVRQAGELLGWGFQLQYSGMVLLLAYLFLLFALSLSGAVQLGAEVSSAGQNWLTKPGWKADVLTGVLAVVVASPCTAPLMGTALGYAVLQPDWVALSIFIALAVGLASPLLLVAFWPASRRLLPKPGRWMTRLKLWLALPLYLTTGWLLWVFGRQLGTMAFMLALSGALLIALACVIWGLVQRQRVRPVWRWSAGVLVLLACCLPLGWQAPPVETIEAGSQQWSEQRLKQWLQQGQPVLVNMTADWCITCLVNEQVALNTQSNKAALALYGVRYLKGDWSRKDPAITRYLRHFQRSGVPLYVLYWPGLPPEVLPQILLPDTVRTSLERLSQQAETQTTQLEQQ